MFVKRWDRGIPSYAPGHIANVEAIFARLERTPGLYLNNNAYRGIAMNDCARNGSELRAERIAASRGCVAASGGHCVKAAAISISRPADPSGGHAEARRLLEEDEDRQHHHRR